jgi:hypothetical protein
MCAKDGKEIHTSTRSIYSPPNQLAVMANCPFLCTRERSTPRARWSVIHYNDYFPFEKHVRAIRKGRCEWFVDPCQTIYDPRALPHLAFELADSPQTTAEQSTRKSVLYVARPRIVHKPNLGNHIIPAQPSFGHMRRSAPINRTVHTTIQGQSNFGPFLFLVRVMDGLAVGDRHPPGHQESVILYGLLARPPMGCPKGA